MFTVINWKHKCAKRNVIVTAYHKVMIMTLYRLYKIFLIGNLLVQLLFCCALFLSFRFRSLVVFRGHFIPKRVGWFKVTFPHASGSFVVHEWRTRESRQRLFKITSRKCLRNHYPVPHNNAVWLEDRKDWSILTKKCERMSIRDWMV